MALVDNRYAKAFFDLAKQENTLDTCRDELKSVSEIYREDSAFRAFLGNMKISKASKKEVINNVFENKLGKSTMGFLLLLLDKDRIGDLIGICAAFDRLYDEEKNILNLKIVSAYALDHDSVDQISEKFRDLYHAAGVRAETALDPSLLGGVKVIVGDRQYDASVREKLSLLRTTLLALGQEKPSVEI